MNMKKSVSRLVTLVTVIGILMSSAAVFGCLGANAATREVSLYTANTIFYRHSQITLDVYVKTDGSCSNQSVTIHHFYRDGEPWQDTEAEYVTTLSDGSKIWNAQIPSWGYHTEYVIKYTADGVTTWDNNNGRNYTNELLGTAPIEVVRQYNYMPGYISAAVKNLAYEKNVVVRYTTDNWETYADTPLSYVDTRNDGTEIWSVNLGLPYSVSDSYQFCLYYNVNGTTYWANNFGRNYDAHFVMGH